MSQLQDRNSQSLDDATAAYNDRLLAPTSPPSYGFYLGYDGDRARHKVQSLTGDIYHGQFISTGAVGIGDKVSISLTRGGIPQFDAMPR
jgi:hypothetical protein